MTDRLRFVLCGATLLGEAVIVGSGARLPQWLGLVFLAAAVAFFVLARHTPEDDQ